MQSLIANTAQLARALAVAPSATDVWSQFKAFLDQHGFHHLSVLRVSDDLPHRVAGAVLYLDGPQGFAEEFDREQLGPHSPEITRALTTVTPFTSIETRATVLTPEQRRVLQRINVTLNVRDGWTFPIHYCGQLRGIVMVGGLTPDMSHLLSATMHLLAHAAFRRVEELRFGTGVKGHSLTSREVECLRWVALGKTDNEIATIVGIGKRTVRFHVENVKRKLRVATRVQAVTEAIRQRAIAA